MNFRLLFRQFIYILFIFCGIQLSFTQGVENKSRDKVPVGVKKLPCLLNLLLTFSGEMRYNT